MTRVLSFAERQNHTLLEVGGEACYLLKRYTRANDSFQKASRRVGTLTKTASAYSTDPDTGMLRYRIWQDGIEPVDEYPDIGVFTCTVAASASTDVWEPAVDKYSFIANRQEYAFDIFQDQVDSNMNAIPDAIYIVFNTAPFVASNVSIFNFGTISPLVDFRAMQPVRDNQTGFQNSLFGFDQWLDLNARIRRRRTPHRFLLAFPGTMYDFTLSEAGFIRESRREYWTTADPYSPVVVEHDVFIRESSGQRFQIVDYQPIYIEDRLVSQHFNATELDPRSTVYQIPYVTG
jgi:hypothetical protein